MKSCNFGYNVENEPQGAPQSAHDTHKQSPSVPNTLRQPSRPGGGQGSGTEPPWLALGRMHGLDEPTGPLPAALSSLTLLWSLRAYAGAMGAARMAPGRPPRGSEMPWALLGVWGLHSGGLGAMQRP